MAQVYRQPLQPLSAQMQAQMYHARKRRRARSEATVDKGGLRAQQSGVGLRVVVIVSTA